MAKNQFTGLLQQYGLPAASEQELLAARTKARMQEVKATSRDVGGNAKERDFRRIGSLLGGALGIKLNPSKLSPEEVKQHEAVATAQVGYEQAVAKNPQISSDPILQELTYQKKLAEALIQTEQYDKAIPMFAQVEQKRRAYEKQKMELKKLGIDIRDSETVADAREFEFEQAQRGEFTTVYPKDSWNENSGADMFLDPETGDAVTMNTEGEVMSRMPAGTFTTARPQAAPATKAGRPMTPGDYGVSDKRAGEISMRLQAAREQMRSAERIRDILKESAEVGSPGINILGTQGTLTTTGARIVDLFQGVARQIGGSITVGDEKADMNKPSVQRKYITDNRTSLQRELAQFMPETVRKDSELQEQYYSAMIRMTNARMRAVEPGARQLSDEDFRRAMRETAGSTTNPEAFRRIMLGNVLESAREAKDALDWLPPTVPHDMIVNPRELAEFNNELEEFERAFNMPFGTSSNPGIGITGEATTVTPSGERTPVDMGELDAYYGTQD